MHTAQFNELTAKSGDYPDFLTREEKADIQSALLEYLKQNGRLSDYLRNLQLLISYPEEAPQKEKSPVVVTVQINAS